ncbi:MAG: adenylate/guanylate cyclase domain-containing protein [Limnothrix sp. RL_2_0]|nr:adenylate/guanylate cyclase domain-containing protein [Limnothrix sp. RL_2_0]
MTSFLVAASSMGLFRSLEWAASDQLFRIRREQGLDENIVIVTIDEDDIQSVDQWPMADRDLAKVLSNIKAQQPRAIALDLYRDLEVAPGNDALVEVFQTTPNLIGVQKIAGDTIDPSPDLAAQGQTAANDLILDADGKIRRGTVLLTKEDDSLIEGLAIKLAMIFLGEEGINLEVIDEEKSIYGLGQATFIPLSPSDGEYRQKDMGGYQIVLNYRGGLDFFRHISLADVLEGSIPPDLMTDKVVMIGPTAPSLNDIHQTPYNNSLFFSEPLVPGIVIHANLTSQIISAALENRAMLRLSPRVMNYAIILALVAFSTILGRIYLSNRLLAIAYLLLSLGTIVAIAYGAFLLGWIIPIFTPLFTIVTATAVAIISNLWLNLKNAYKDLKQQHKILEHVYHQLEETNHSYSRFVPFDYLDFLQKEKIMDVNLGDHVNREMSILFSDIRSFTPLAESMTPKENFDFINAYLQQLSPEIRNHRGLIVKFLGDGVMAIFPNSPEDALDSAIAQFYKLDIFNQERCKLDDQPIRIGLAIHSGKIMVGIVGEASRMQSDILSDSVNLTARLESLTKFYGVSLIISETVFWGIENHEKYDIHFLDRVIVKGKKMPISIYEVFNCDSETLKVAKRAAQTRFTQALEFYHLGKFLESRTMFDLLNSEYPEDRVFRIYIARLNQLVRDRVSNSLSLQEQASWDGIWRFDEKY